MQSFQGVYNNLVIIPIGQQEEQDENDEDVDENDTYDEADKNDELPNIGNLVLNVQEGIYGDA